MAPQKANLNPVFKKNMVLFEKDYLDQILSEDSFIKNYVDIKVFNSIYEKLIKGEEVSDSSYAIFLVSELLLWFNINNIFE